MLMSYAEARGKEKGEENDGKRAKVRRAWGNKREGARGVPRSAMQSHAVPCATAHLEGAESRDGLERGAAVAALGLGRGALGVDVPEVASGRLHTAVRGGEGRGGGGQREGDGETGESEEEE